MPLVRVSGDLIVEVNLVSHRAKTLGVRRWDPLIDGNCVGVEVPFENYPISLPGLEAVGAVQDYMVHGPIADNGGHLEGLQTDGRHWT